MGDKGENLKGALLVAPPDVEREGMPEGVKGFAPIPLNSLPFSSVLVASRSDESTTFERAELFARA